MQDQPSRKILTTKFFYMFWWHYFPHYHQRSIPGYKVQQANQWNKSRLLIIDARDHGKSALWSCGYPLYLALANPFGRPVINLSGGGFRYEHFQEETISQISAAGDLPEKWMRRHKTELQYNKRIVADFGEQTTANMREGMWSADEILLKNGAHIYSKGSGAQIRGDHPTELIVDDLEDRKRSQNPENRKKDREYFFADLYGALEPDSRLKVIGTIVHQEALIKLLYEKEIKPPPGLEHSPLFKELWAKFKYAAIKPDGTALAPEIWSYERLMLRKAEIPISVWRAEYMNNPESSDNPIFPQVWFRPEHNGYDPNSDEFKKAIEPNLKYFSFFDPAAGRKEQNDYSALVTLGLYKKGSRPKVYVCEVKRFRGSFRHQLTEALNTWIRFRGVMGFEAIAYQSVLGATFKEICDEAHYHPETYLTTYQEKKKHKKDKPKPLDKESRANRITHWFELGRIFFNYRDPMQDILMDDLKVFPTGEHDDTVDGTVGALWEIDRRLKFIDDEKAAIVQISYDETTGIPSYHIDNENPIDLF